MSKYVELSANCDLHAEQLLGNVNPLVEILKQLEKLNANKTETVSIRETK